MTLARVTVLVAIVVINLDVWAKGNMAVSE